LLLGEEIDEREGYNRPGSERESEPGGKSRRTTLLRQLVILKRVLRENGRVLVREWRRFRPRTGIGFGCNLDNVTGHGDLILTRAAY